MHLQGDPGGAVVVGKTESISLATFQYHRQPLALAEAAQRRAAFEAGRIGQGAEHVFAGIELRRHSADQGGEVVSPAMVLPSGRSGGVWRVCGAAMYKENESC
ncbi:hypothetical protein D9M71_635400 [compost metagenome]